jgi:hypothetical protein
MNKYIRVLKVGDFDPKYTYRKPQMTLKNNLQRAAYDHFFLEGCWGYEKIDQWQQRELWGVFQYEFSEFVGNFVATVNFTPKYNNKSLF